MGNPADYNYYVIETPYEGIDEFVCMIPWTWIVSRTGNDIVVSYPGENLSVTEQCVKDMEGLSKEWKSYESVVRCGFYSYDQAKLITTKMNQLYHYQDCSIKDCGVCGGNESWECLMRPINRSQQDAHSKQNIHKPVEPSKNDDRSATKTRPKRTPQSNPDTETALKRSKVGETAESAIEVTEQLCQAIECPNENSSLEPLSIADPELFTVILTSLRDLHKSSTTNHSVIDIALKTLIMNDKIMKDQAKLIVDLRAALASKGTTAAAEKIPKKKNKKQKALDDEDDDDDHEVVNKKRYRPKIVLPPEYNENDSRWTLKHRELAPGLVELIPLSSVYINEVQLIHCKRLAKDCRSLARFLMPDIFTKNALSVCSLTGSRARAYDVQGAFVRPGLDENARNAILDFVEEYGREKGWKVQENQSTLIKNGMRNLMKQIREKYG